MRKRIKIITVCAAAAAIAVMGFAAVHFAADNGAAPAVSMTKTEIMQAAKTDPVKAASGVNAIRDTDDFLNGVRDVLDYYYTNNKTKKIRTCDGKISSRADDTVENYRTAASERAKKDTKLGYRTGEICVVVKKDLSRSELDAMAEKYRGRCIEITELSDTEKMAVFTTSLEYTVDKAARTVKSGEDDVEYTQPNQLYKLSGTDDSDAALQDGAGSEAANSSSTKAPAAAVKSYTKQWYLNSIDAAAAWNTQKSVASKKIRIAVIDSGCDMRHPDLKAAINRKLSVKIYNGKRTKLTKLKSGDRNGHGTHVTGIIGATGNNGIGITGVAAGGTNGRLDIVAVNVADKGDYLSDSDCVRAITYARKKHCRVINCSWGTYYYSSRQSMVLKRAVDTASKEKILVVGAAGNGNKYGYGITKRFLPGDYSSAVSVIALDGNGSRTVYSNYGSRKDIAAPGGEYNIFGSTNSSIGIYSTYKGQTYKSLVGTSQAAPMVTATAAMMLSVNNTLTVPQMKSILYSTTSPHYSARNYYYGFGRLDAARAVFKSTKPTVSASYVCDTNERSITIRHSTVSGSGTIDYEYDYYDAASKKWIILGYNTANGIKLSDNIKSAVTGTVYAAITPGVRYQFRVRAYDEKTKLYNCYSATKSVIPRVAAPTGFRLTTSPDASSSATLNWNAVSNVSGYQIARYADGKWRTVLHKSYSAGAAGLNYSDTGLTEGKNYSYRISTELLIGSKYYYSSWVMISRPVIGRTTLTKVSAGHRKLSIYWSRVAGAHQYRIYRSTRAGSGYKLVKTAAASSSKWTNRELKGGRRYYYKIVTVKKTVSSSYPNGVIGTGAYSNIRSGKTKR